MTALYALWTGALLALGGPVTEVAIAPADQHTSVLIAVDGDVEFRDFTMEGPYRLVVDVLGARHALPNGEFSDVNRGGVRSVRASQYSDEVVRVVLVLSETPTYTIAPDPRGIRITLDNAEGDFAPWSSGGAAGAPAAPAAPTARPQAAAVDGRASAASSAAGAIPQQLSAARRISITFNNSPIQDVLLAFASFSGKSIVPGSDITGLVTATIQDQPWDIARRHILSGQGLVAEEDEYGIIRVDNISKLNEREAIEPIYTVAHRINYATAAELQTAMTPLLSARGKVTVGQGTNTLVVSDINRVQTAVRELLRDLDVRTPQVSIQAKIIFVNRTDLDEMGLTYELKDSRGNQLNQLSDGAADLNGVGVLDLPDEAVQQGEAVVLLGGNSIAALGNAKERLTSPSLSLLSSLVIGRHQLITFLDALHSVQLSDVQAIPQVTTLDNVQARLKVGADVPVRTIDAGAGGGGGQTGVFPTAQVSTEETGIILQATPHVTANGNILLDLMAERSSAEFTASDAGFIKNTQEAATRVLVEDGETVVIAGLTQSERTEFRSGIPLLMDLPVIGRLFRVKREQMIQRDLIILVTPHIVRGSN
ncbi:MAG: AMIN domain-containing protein [Gemmatimonadetes bacterium]|nr:AMIN domain-containing protein [Gemmatimonadota bacterium]